MRWKGVCLCLLLISEHYLICAAVPLITGKDKIICRMSVGVSSTKINSSLCSNLFFFPSLIHNFFFLSLLLQSDVREAHLWDCEHVAPSLPGQPVCMLPDPRACVFRHGVHGRRRPDDAHPHRRLHRAARRVRNLSLCVGQRGNATFGLVYCHIQ